MPPRTDRIPHRLRAAVLSAALPILLPALPAAAQSLDFQMPWQQPSSPTSALVEASTFVSRADVYFLFDRGGSMAAEMGAMQANFLAIVADRTCAATATACSLDTDCGPGNVCFEGLCVEDPAIDGCVADLWTGMGVYDECDTYTNLVPLQADPAVTAGAFPGVGGGAAEAPVQAVACVANPALHGGSPGCGADPSVPDPIGCPGFREDAFRILLHYTDADNQAGAACAAVTTAMAGAELSSRRILYGAVASNGDDGVADPLTPLGRCGQLAFASGSVNSSGQPVVVNGLDANAVPGTIDAVRTLLENVPVTMSVELRDDPSDSVDARVFVDYLEVGPGAGGNCSTGFPTADTNADGHDDIYQGVLPGTPLCWSVHPIAANNVVPAEAVDREYRATLLVRAHGGVVDSRELVFTVPADPSVAAPVAGAGPLALTVRPNPGRGGTSLAFTLPAAGRTASLVIYDVRGQVVRRLLPADAGALSGTVRRTWNGRDDRGARVAAGLYFAALESEGRRTVRRIVLLD